MVILISDKGNFRIKNITKEKEGQFTMMQDQFIKTTSQLCIQLNVCSQSFKIHRATTERTEKDFKVYSYV